MANYRAMPIYVNGGKVGEIKDTSFKVMANGEQIITLEDVEETEGVVTTEGSCGTFVPVGGMNVDLVQLVIDQTPVQIGLLTNGKIYKIKAKFTEAEITSTSKSGVCEGKFSWRGGKPKVTG